MQEKLMPSLFSLPLAFKITAGDEQADDSFIDDSFTANQFSIYRQLNGQWTKIKTVASPIPSLPVVSGISTIHRADTGLENDIGLVMPVIDDKRTSTMAISGQPSVNDNLKYVGDSELLYGDINGILEPPILAGDDYLAVEGNYNALYGDANAMIEFTEGGKDYLTAKGDRGSIPFVQ